MTENTEVKTERENILQLVSFRIGVEIFGVDILKVQEINRTMNITAVPNAPTYVEGVVNLRGRVIPIVSLRQRLNLEKIDHNNRTRIVVVELDNKTIGFVVDEVSEVLRIPENIVEPPPKMVAGIGSEYITGVAKLDDGLLILLELNEILTAKEVQLLETTTN